jgi:hypothetical protein
LLTSESAVSGAAESPNLQRNKFVPLQVAGFNPEEVLGKLSEHRFRPEGKFRKSELGFKD